MSSVFVIISETMPVNGTYPASSNVGFFGTEDDAVKALFHLHLESGPADLFEQGQTVFYAEVDPEKYEYIEYRIEEHVVQHGE